MQSQKQNVFADLIRHYHTESTAFVRDMRKVEPDEWQSDLLEWISSGNRRISIASGHGVGKTAAASWAMLWYLLTRFP